MVIRVDDFFAGDMGRMSHTRIQLLPVFGFFAQRWYHTHY